MAAHNEDLEEHLAPAEDFLEDTPHADGFPDNLDCIAEIPHERIGLPELPEYDSGIGCQDGQYHDQDDTGHETDGGQRRGQRQDTQRDGLGDQNNAALPTRESASQCGGTRLRRSRTYHHVRLL